MADAFENWTVQVRKGLLELCILNALEAGERYGYELVKALIGVPGLGITEGTIYPLLSRLRVQGLVTTRLVESPEGPAREYYALTEKGKKAVREFKEKTTTDIRKNIAFLKERDLLAGEFYQNSEPRGIFVVINKSEEELFQYHIGSVSLSFFTRTRKEEASKYARICVSVPHDDFVRFLNPLTVQADQ